MLYNFEARDIHTLGSFSEGDRTSNLVSQLRACSSSRELQKGKRLHAEAVRCGRDESDIYVVSSLLNMYCKCGSVKDAEVVFERSPYHNVVTWTTMIFGYSENGQGRLALEYFHRLQEEGCAANARTLVAVIKACSSIAKEEAEPGGLHKLAARKSVLLKTGMEIHRRARSVGMDTGIFVANALVDMYSNCGGMVLAREVFERIKFPDAVSWTSLITGYMENGEEEVALELFDRMHRRESYCAPSSRTFVAALKACAGLAGKGTRSLISLERGMALHSRAAAFGFDKDVFVANTLVDLYGKCGVMLDARKIFDGMVHHTVVSWTALMLGYVENGEPKAALDVFASMMASDSEPDSRAFVAATKACTGLSVKGDGSQVVALEIGMFLHSQAEQNCFTSGLMLGNAQIDMYVKCGSLRDAHKVFDRMKRRDLVSWTELMLGYAESDRAETSLDLFQELLVRNDCCSTSLDGPVFVAALKACMNLADAEPATVLDGKSIKTKSLERCMAVHSLAADSHLQSNDRAFVTNSVVDLYVKSGSISDATNAFFSIDPSLRGTVAWTVLIQGHVTSGDGAAALEMFEQMKLAGLSLDVKAYAAGIKACEAATSLTAAKFVYSDLCRLGMEQDPVLSTCLVNCYAKSGDLADAQHIFDSLPSRSVVTWNALVTGYSHQGPASRVLELWKEMREEGVTGDALSYLSLLTTCSHAGLVRECREMFETMRREAKVELRIEHYHCVIDMLGRAGEIDEAVAMVRQMRQETNEVTWRAVLGACARSKDSKLAKVAFEFLEQAKDVTGAVHTMMANSI